MSEPVNVPEKKPEPKAPGRWTWVLAAIPLAFAILLLVVSLASGRLNLFLVLWPVFQLGGYWMALNMSGGKPHGPALTAQLLIHWMLLVFIVVIVARAAQGGA